jgi:hypothetical protein
MMRYPDFFIAGNSKSGTTALYHFLAQHPGIFMSNPKEPNFFATDFLHDEGVGAFHRRTRKEYQRCFVGGRKDQVWGEASACYLYSKAAAANIHASNPEAKVIVLFREPVSFLYSYHLQMLQNPVSEGETVKDFASALALEPQRKEGQQLPNGCLVPQLLYYSERVNYAEQLLRYTELFGGDQLRVYLYEDFKANNEAVYHDILDFLGLMPVNSSPVFEHHNRSVKVKLKSAQNFAYNMSHGNGWYAPIHTAIKAVIPRPVRRFLTRSIYQRLAFKPKPELSDEVRQELKCRFKPQVERFSQVLEKDLVTRWQYDHV